MPIQCVVNVKAAEHRNVIEQLEQSVAVLAGQVCTVDLFRPNLLEERLDVTSRGVDEVQSLFLFGIQRELVGDMLRNQPPGLVGSL